MPESAFSQTFSRVLADRGRSTAWILLAAVALLGAWNVCYGAPEHSL